MKIATKQLSQSRGRSCGALRSHNSHKVAVAVAERFQSWSRLKVKTGVF